MDGWEKLLIKRLWWGDSGGGRDGSGYNEIRDRKSKNDTDSVLGRGENNLNDNISDDEEPVLLFTIMIHHLSSYSHKKVLFYEASWDNWIDQDLSCQLIQKINGALRWFSGIKSPV